MKKVFVLFAFVAVIMAGCALPSREKINEAKNARDGAERPLNESTPTDE
jgi:hypothetical protein